MNHVYRYMRSLNFTEELISKTEKHIHNKILLWRRLNLPVTPSPYLFEDHIVNQMRNFMGGLADKSEDILKEFIKMVNIVKEYMVG